MSPSIFATVPQRRIPRISMWSVTRRVPAGDDCDPSQANRVAGDHCICWYYDGSWRQIVPTRRPRESPDSGLGSDAGPGDRGAADSRLSRSGRGQGRKTAHRVRQPKCAFFWLPHKWEVAPLRDLIVTPRQADTVCPSIVAELCLMMWQCAF